MATESFLGLGKLIARMVLMKPRDDTDDCEQALVGNTILVAQPSPEMLATELPPPETEQAQYFNVIYVVGSAEHGPSNLRKKNALLASREEYSECAQLWKERCPLFADLRINVDEAGTRLPATGVPAGLEQGAARAGSGAGGIVLPRRAPRGAPIAHTHLLDERREEPLIGAR